MHPKIEKPGLLLYKTGSFGSEFWPKSQKLFGSTARRKVVRSFPHDFPRQGRGGLRALATPAEGLRRCHPQRTWAGATLQASWAAAAAVAAAPPMPERGIPAQFRVSGAGACRAGGTHRAWRCPSPSALSEEAGASIERRGRRVAPMCGKNAARPAAAPLISSAHSPEVDQIESGGKLRDETCGFNFGITA